MGLPAANCNYWGVKCQLAVTVGELFFPRWPRSPVKNTADGRDAGISYNAKLSLVNDVLYSSSRRCIVDRKRCAYRQSGPTASGKQLTPIQVQGAPRWPSTQVSTSGAGS